MSGWPRLGAFAEITQRIEAAGRAVEGNADEPHLLTEY